NGFWPFAVSVRRTESRRGFCVLPWTKRLSPARRRANASSGVLGKGAADAANAISDAPVIDVAPADRFLLPLRVRPRQSSASMVCVTRSYPLPENCSPETIGPRLCALEAGCSGFLGRDHPHCKKLGAAAVGVTEGGAGAVHLVLARLAPHLQGGLGEAQHARRADRVRRQHAARHVHRQLAVERGGTLLRHLPAVALGHEAE